MFKLLRNLILGCSIVLILPGNAAAEINAREFLKKYDSATGDTKFTYLQYMNGTGNGLSWANSLLGKKYPKAVIYCPPKKLKVAASLYITILRQFVAKSPKYGTWPVGGAMMFALKNKWPC